MKVPVDRTIAGSDGPSRGRRPASANPTHPGEANRDNPASFLLVMTSEAGQAGRLGNRTKNGAYRLALEALRMRAEPTEWSLGSRAEGEGGDGTATASAVLKGGARGGSDKARLVRTFA